jgi:hypothetical protein
MWPDEPKGWSHLQEMAKREKNPKRLVEIINQMIRLLDEREGRTAPQETKGHSGDALSDSCE